MVTWKPFQIDPGTAVDGEEFEAYNQRRWGSSAWTRHLISEGAKEGAEFKNWKWWPNSSRAHQFIQYGIDKHSLAGQTDRLNQVLFTALYEHGENISLTETLVKIGEKEFPDCDTDALRHYLEDNRGMAKVQRDIAEGRRKYDIRGVPFFVVESEVAGRPFVCSGAQPASTFLDVFQELSGS
jgi:predicted DsbA family dithiol-disulfide isomerase